MLSQRYIPCLVQVFSTSKAASKTNSMEASKGIKNYLENIFLIEEARGDTGLLYNAGRFVLSGLRIWTSASSLVLPAPVLWCSAFLMLMSIVLHNIVNKSLDLMDNLINYAWITVYVSANYTILVYKKDLNALINVLDRWWKYDYLEKDTAHLKKKAEDWMKTFNKCYYVAAIATTFLYSILPIVKFFYKDPSERIGALVFPAWTPLPLHTVWGFFIVYVWEVTTISMAMILYSEVFSLLMTFSIVIKYQLQLVGIAFGSIKGRICKRMVMKDLCPDEWYEEYIRLFDREIRSCVIHFQHLYSSSFLMSRAFSAITNVTYQGGMWVMCMIGVKAATEMTTVNVVQAVMLVTTIILNLYFSSFVSECFIEEVEKLRISVYDSPWYEMPIKTKRSYHIFLTMLDADRFPTLRTFMGTKTNMENLSKVVNASYYYFSMIITTKAS